MFTLSEKIKVLNTPSLVKLFDNSNAEVTVAANAASTDKLVVEGYGNFPVAKIVDIKLERAIAPVKDSKDFLLLDSIGGVDTGEALEVIVSVETGRYQAEILAQNAIGKGRTIKFSTLPLEAKTDADLAAAIVAGWEKHLELFAIGTPFINVVAGVNDATNSINVSATAGNESVIISKVEVKRVAQSIATPSPVKLAEDVIAAGTEGTGQGKFLEESVRMATTMNNDPYGADNTDTRVDLRGNYTAVSFSVQAEYDQKLSIVAADAPVGTAVHKFVLYINEATSLAANSAIDKLAEVALLVAAVQADVTVSGTFSNTEALVTAAATSVATPAEFIA